MRKTAGGEPEPRLGGAPPHVAQFAAIVEAPDRADAVGNGVTEIAADSFLLA